METETNNNGVEVNNHSAEPHQNGTVHKEKMSADHETHKEAIGGENNGHAHHDTATNGKDTQDKVDNQVSSSEETTTPVTDNSADNNEVESSTDDKPEEAKQDEDRVDSSKRSLEEPDTVAKKIARFENGNVTSEQPEEPTVEPTPATNGHGKDDAHIKADTGKDTAEIDQDVVGQGTAV